MTTQIAFTSQSRHVAARAADADSRSHRNYPGLLAILGIAAVLCGATPAMAQSAPPLGRAQSFAVLGGSAVTVAGPAGTVINGDVGSAPTPTITGFPPALVSPGFTAYAAANAITANARTDAGAAYTNLAAQICPAANIIAGGNLGGLNLPAGVYCMPTGNLVGTLTLTGSATDIWVFQMTLDTLTTAGASQVVMGGAANPCNVFWQVSSSATLGAASTFRGNIFSGVSIDLGTTTNVIGRTIAGSGAVTMAGTDTIGGCSVLGPGLAAASASTVASASVALGAPISDAATLSGGGLGSASPTGTITFNLYAPTDPACVAAPVFTSVVPVNGNGPYSSTPFVSAAIGTYNWIANYSGDANNAATANICGAAGESVIVTAGVGPPANAMGGPTLSEWAMIMLAGLLAIAGSAALRR